MLAAIIIFIIITSSSSSKKRRLMYFQIISARDGQRSPTIALSSPRTFWSQFSHRPNTCWPIMGGSHRAIKEEYLYYHRAETETFSASPFLLYNVRGKSVPHPERCSTQRPLFLKECPFPLPLPSLRTPQFPGPTSVSLENSTSFQER